MTQTTYLDFELEISDGADGRYPVSLLHSPAGEARGELILPEQGWAEEADFSEVTRPEAQAFGTALFTALLNSAIRERYAVSQQIAAQAGKGLRLKLRITPAALLPVPWELLYDPQADEFVCLTRQTPLVRYLTLAQVVEPLTMQPPLRILAMMASPRDLPALDVAGEKARLTQALTALQENYQVELTWVTGESWRDLQQALQSGPWHVFHYVGHADFDVATDEGAIWLANANGQAQRFTAREVARLLADQPSLRLVVLNACAGAQSGVVSHFSSLAGRLVRRGLPAVIAMQTAIRDSAALEFAQSFYRALATLPVDAALSEARKAISFRQPETVEWATPVLYLRAPDGWLWAEAGQPEKPQEQSMSERKEIINTGGAAYIGGNAKVGRDLIGRDKIVHGDDVRGHKAGGNVMITTIGDNAKNVAVGEEITQTVVEGGASTINDKQVIEQQLLQLQVGLQALQGKVEAGKLQMADFQLKLLQGELTKTAADQTPSASTITQIGDWLLDNLPELAGVLTSLFTNAAVGKVLQKAGQSAVAWVKRRIA